MRSVRISSVPTLAESQRKASGSHHVEKGGATGVFNLPPSTLALYARLTHLLGWGLLRKLSFGGKATFPLFPREYQPFLVTLMKSVGVCFAFEVLEIDRVHFPKRNHAT